MVTYPYAHMAYIMLYCVEWDVKLYHTIPPPLAGLAGGGGISWHTLLVPAHPG